MTSGSSVKIDMICAGNKIVTSVKGAVYFRWSIPQYFLLGVSLTLTMILRSLRKVTVPLITSIISFFVNIGCNYIFIFGKLGFPEMQIAGAALGTVCARVVEVLIIGGYFLVVEKDRCV